MEKKNNNLTGNVIAIIISLMTIVTVFGGFISNQAKLEVELINIKTQLAEINSKLGNRDEEIKTILERLTRVESKRSDS